MNKYELTDETKTLEDGTVLRRIRDVRDFTLANGCKIRVGKLGGWIENESNLSHDGKAWVDDEACVSGRAHVLDDARVLDRAAVCDNACVCDTAEIYGDAIVSGRAKVCGAAKVGSTSDYSVYKNTWSSGRRFTYTRSNGMWTAGCFHGTGKELIEKAYRDSDRSGRCYETIVRAQEALDRETVGGETT